VFFKHWTYGRFFKHIVIGHFLEDLASSLLTRTHIESLGYLLEHDTIWHAIDTSLSLTSQKGRCNWKRRGGITIIAHNRVVISPFGPTFKKREFLVKHSKKLNLKHHLSLVYSFEPPLWITIFNLLGIFQKSAI
jgi:hypothetical protein